MQRDLALTPSEQKIVRVLLKDYPAAGLGSASSLARRAGVSDPTVVRLAMKLGYKGFPDFQSQLLAELEANLHSPLLMMESKRLNNASGDPVLGYLESTIAALSLALTATPLQTYYRAATMLMEAKGRVVVLGGRFSRHISGMLASYLSQMRSGVIDIDVVSSQSFDILADLGRRDVLVVFDYRRYQLDVISFAQQAGERGVRMVLFTDPWLSPIAEHAEAIIVSPGEVSSPYDTLVAAVAQMEALVAGLLSSAGDDIRARIEMLEDVRRANFVTLDSNDETSGNSDRFPRKPAPKKVSE